MKQLLEKVFNKKICSPIFIGLGTFAIFTFIIFPGLTASDTLINVVSALVGLFTLAFIFYYMKGDEILETINDIEPGETELDYIPKEEVEKIKKKVTKKKMQPHVVHPKAQVVLGEYQIKKGDPFKNKKKQDGKV
jgi:hypothetical protein